MLKRQCSRISLSYFCMMAHTMKNKAQLFVVCTRSLKAIGSCFFLYIAESSSTPKIITEVGAKKVYEKRHIVTAYCAMLHWLHYFPYTGCGIDSAGVASLVIYFSYVTAHLHPWQQQQALDLPFFCPHL